MNQKTCSDRILWIKLCHDDAIDLQDEPAEDNLAPYRLNLPQGAVRSVSGAPLKHGHR